MSEHEDPKSVEPSRPSAPEAETAELAVDLTADATPQEDPVVSKRELLQWGVDRARKAGAYATSFALEHVADRFTPRVCRPPGAIAELEFLLACTRCGECSRVCPPNAIRVLDHRAGASSGTPFLDLNGGRPCVVCNDPPCMKACPTGALQQIDMRDAVMGFAALDRDTCRAWNEIPCDTCIRVCPYPGDAILADLEGRVYVDPRHCIGCGLCASACPTNPKSIEMEPPPRF